MNLTDLQVELREIETIQNSLVSRLAALHSEIENMKPQDTSDQKIEFARITSEAAKKPLFREDLRAAQPPTKKAFFAALAYLIALDGEDIEGKLYYLCRLAAGCNYQVSAEELCLLGLAYTPKDMNNLRQNLGYLQDWFIVEALVLANLAGSASRGILGALATMADSLDIDADKMRNLGRKAQAMLCFGMDYSVYKVGDVFTFGNYSQGANGAVQPIEWQVLRRDSDGLLVIAKFALDCKPYNESRGATTWSQCTLRNWLNSDFSNRAFNVVERSQIKQVHLKNPNSPSNWNNVRGGPDTDDKIFLLSHDEAEQLFANNNVRMCKATEYAKRNNVYTNDGNGMCVWWLRSPGYDAYYVAYVYYDGGIGSNNVNSDFYAVRPALIIAL